MLPVSITQAKRAKKVKQVKKPRFEPRAKIAPGDHPIVFTKASEING